MRVFVDTSAWYAYFDKADISHQKAVKFFRLKHELVTSNIVIHETIALCTRRLTFSVAKKIGQFLFNSGLVSIITSTLTDEKKAWQFFIRQKSAKASFVDVNNKIIMQKMYMKHIFAFDDDFNKLGLIVMT